MNINVDKINQLQKNDNQNYNDDVSLLASCEVVNHIAAKHRSAYRLSPGAKRMLILKRLDKCNDKDFALLMRLLNEIDKADDNNNPTDNNVTFTWAVSSDDKKDTNND